MSTPTIITRASANLPPPRRPLIRVDTHPGVIVHCTGGHRPHDLRGALERWRIVHTFHTSPPRLVGGKNVGGRGWSYVGYHFGVAPTGELLEGRGWNTLGAHAGTGRGHNRWLGLVLFGRGGDITAAERATIEWLVNEVGQRARATAPVLPHNALSRRSCPGPAVTRWLLERWPSLPEAG